MPLPHQQAALAALFQRILEAPSPFYRHRLHAVGRSSAGDHECGTLARMQLTHRDDLLDDQLQHLPHGTRRFPNASHPVRTGISGSGASLLVLTWTAADLAGERAAGTHLLERLGVTPGMRVANTLPGALSSPGSLLLGDVVEELGALDIPLGVVDGDAAARSAWELLDRVHPDVVILDGASAARMFADTPTATRGWWRGIVWLRTGNDVAAPPSPPPAAGFAGWQRLWLAVAEATSFVAYSCAAARLHTLDHAVIEVVDEASGAPCATGEVGTLVVTPLAGDTPLLRYASSVRVRVAAPPCRCGAHDAGFELI